MECARLSIGYYRLRTVHLDALNELQTTTSGASVRVYKAAQIKTNEAWLEAEVARLELERHKREHRKGN